MALEDFSVDPRYERYVYATVKDVHELIDDLKQFASDPKYNKLRSEIVLSTLQVAYLIDEIERLEDRVIEMKLGPTQ